MVYDSRFKEQLRYLIMKISVYGSATGDLKDDVQEKAKELGREIVRRGHVLITGGTTGLPYQAVLGAAELKGKCIAFSPAVDLEAHKNHGYPANGFTEFIFIPKDYVHADNLATDLDNTFRQPAQNTQLTF